MHLLNSFGIAMVLFILQIKKSSAGRLGETPEGSRGGCEKSDAAYRVVACAKYTVHLSNPGRRGQAPISYWSMEVIPAPGKTDHSDCSKVRFPVQACCTDLGNGPKLFTTTLKIAEKCTGPNGQPLKLWS
ncbi:hypothetical protein H4Q26_011425 [Puccinia striiformis f. sp. tritici PST-130]|nr:hypothetical protein Pst134EB_020002 [Puccinia striiformis f. sp. tritici]KAI9615484.1 hypothetical protein H4Q26_011425 [Puccinia striiformis f. sp. tritici PST-130]